MKDALVRDKFATQKEVLCFKMEVAGLMNVFPCIVIRGIYDYTDTYKNDTWQGYAVIVVVAYIRDLLYKIAP
jgi:nucleoside phosphorylase